MAISSSFVSCCTLMFISALCIDPPFAKLIRDSWFAKVVVMSERVMSARSPEQIHEQTRELLDSLYRVDSGRILKQVNISGRRDFGTCTERRLQ